MLNPIHSNNPSKGVEPVSLPGAVLKTEEIKPSASNQDTAEISSLSKGLEAYVSKLQAVPDVRSDKVAQAKEKVNTDSPPYPPLAVIKGLGKLLGGVDKPEE